MTDIDLDDIRRMDGGLLLVFRELVRTGRTTSAAARLGMSQSAVSHSLSRLRDIFGDQLFQRRPHGLEPTARALELAPRIDDLLDMMAASLTAGSGFDPARSRRRFNIGLTEYGVGVFTGSFVEGLHAAAPGTSFGLQFLRGYQAIAALRRGLIDLAVGRFDPAPEGTRSEALFEDAYCAVARVGHPTIQGVLDEAAWRAAEHIFVASTPVLDDVTGPSIGEDPMPRGDEVITLAVVPRWEMALALVADCDAIATGPRRLAVQQAPLLGLQIIEPDPPLPSWTVALARRDETDAGLQWFCQRLKQAIDRV